MIVDAPPAIYAPAPQRHPLAGGDAWLAPVIAIQIADSFITSNTLRQCGGHETFPPLLPFSHGGPMTYAIGFAALDIAAHVLFRHAPKVLHAVEIAQIASSAGGLLMDQTGWCK